MQIERATISEALRKTSYSFVKTDKGRKKKLKKIIAYNFLICATNSINN